MATDFQGEGACKAPAPGGSPAADARAAFWERLLDALAFVPELVALQAMSLPRHKA